MKHYKVGIIGATGMVGQRFALLLADHPWFEVTTLAASPRSAGRTYREAVGSRWAMKSDIPASLENIVVRDAVKDISLIAANVDFVFCAVDMPKDNSANRMVGDVPMIIPELNPEHAAVITAQRERLGTKRGFISVKSNCSIQSYVPALHPLREFGIKRVLACTYQAISGAGKTFERWPEMLDNLIPYIGGEEEKSEKEPLKVWGELKDGVIVPCSDVAITTPCLRVPVSDGHTAAVFVDFEKKPAIDEIKQRWADFKGRPQELELPHAPKQFINYFEQPDRPQAALDRELEGGMAISVGRLREDSMFDYKFVCLSHNTLRGAAGGGVLMAELLAAEGWLD